MLTECDMRNIFLEKSYAKYGGEISSRPFSEKLKLSVWIKSQKFYTVSFHCMTS